MSILKLKPSCKDYLWGGHRLVEEYKKEYSGEVLAETWELSCHPAGPSYVDNGPYKGKTLQEYINQEGKQVLGTADVSGIFPFWQSLLMLGTICPFRFIQTTVMPCKMKGNMVKRRCGM